MLHQKNEPKPTGMNRMRIEVAMASDRDEGCEELEAENSQPTTVIFSVGHDPVI